MGNRSINRISLIAVTVLSSWAIRQKNSLLDLWNPQAVFVESSWAESVTIVLMGAEKSSALLP
jgi:hypothetical protein